MHQILFEDSYRHYNFNLIKMRYLLRWDYLFVLETMGVRELGHLSTTKQLIQSTP